MAPNAASESGEDAKALTPHIMATAVLRADCGGFKHTQVKAGFARTDNVTA